jgi:hypothetical protein
VKLERPRLRKNRKRENSGVGGFAFTPLLFSPGFTSVRLADYSGDGNADFNFQSLFWSLGYDVVEPQDGNGDGKIDIFHYGSTAHFE